MLECVVNVSEGRDGRVEAITSAAGAALLDLHRDAHHNRAVLTLAGADLDAAVRRVATTTVEQLDLRVHTGVHPRIGVLDVVPFVPLGRPSIADAVTARDRVRGVGGRNARAPLFRVRTGTIAPRREARSVPIT